MVAWRAGRRSPSARRRACTRCSAAAGRSSIRLGASAPATVAVVAVLARRVAVRPAVGGAHARRWRRRRFCTIAPAPRARRPRCRDPKGSRSMPAPPNPASELEALRKKLVAARLALPDRLERSVQLQEILRAWLVGRRERVDRRLLADQGRVRSAARALPLERGRRDGEPRRIGLPVADRGDELAALPRLVSGLRDRARRLRHPQAEGHRRVPAAAAGRAVPRLRPGRRAPRLRRRLLRPHAARAAARGR